MKTSARAAYRHTGKSAHADRRSYHKTPSARRPWSIAELQTSMERAMARGDVEFAEMRRQQIQVRRAQLEMENAPDGQETAIAEILQTDETLA